MISRSPYRQQLPNVLDALPTVRQLLLAMSGTNPLARLVRSRFPVEIRKWTLVRRTLPRSSGGIRVHSSLSVIPFFRFSFVCLFFFLTRVKRRVRYSRCRSCYRSFTRRAALVRFCLLDRHPMILADGAEKNEFLSSTRWRTPSALR